MSGFIRSVIATYKWAWQPLDSHDEDSYRLGAAIGVIRLAPIILPLDVALIIYALSRL